MFTQKCFIRKNTPALVKKLEELGYEIPFVVEYGNGDTILAKYGLLCNIHSIPNSIFGENYFSLLTNNAIDCGTNTELFIAIASLRDDTDKNQWFIHKNVEFVFCDQSELKHVIDNTDEYMDYCVADFHKATVSELIEYFNK